MSKHRVVHLTTVHPRYDVRIFHKQCCSLAKSNVEVTLLVSDGKGNEIREGVRIIDIGPAPRNRLYRIIKQPRTALHFIHEIAPQIVHFHDPELLSLGVRLARDGLTVIYDAHEDVPRQIITKQWIPAILRPWVSRLFETYENWHVKRLSAVITSTPHIEARFSSQGIPSLTIANYPTTYELHSETALKTRSTNAICYVGSIARTRGAVQLVRALEKLPGVTLLLCGPMEDAALGQELRALPGWSQVEYMGEVDRAGVKRVLATASVGMVTLLPLPSYQAALPIKMFEYMSAGLPIVASSFPLWIDIINEADCGLCVDPTDSEAIATTVNLLLNDPVLCRHFGENGKKSIQKNYNWSKEEQRLIGAYRKWLDKEPSRRI